MRRLSEQGYVCFAPVYANGTGPSHLYAAAMDTCCKGGTAPVQLGPNGNAPWSDDDEILCGRQCLQVKTWPEDAAERFLETRRFSDCMKRAGVQDFGLSQSPVQCDIDDDLLWDGWKDGLLPDGLDDIDKDDEDGEDRNGSEPDRPKITGDGKACPGPRRTLDEIWDAFREEEQEPDPELGSTPSRPYCAIPVPKVNADWARSIFNSCCDGDLGSFPPWSGEEEDHHCERLCQPEWESDYDEDAQLEAVKKLNKCFLEPQWSNDYGRRPFIPCYGMGNLTLESADPTGQERSEGGASTDEKDGNSNDDESDEDNNGSNGSEDDNGSSDETEDEEDSAPSYRTSATILSMSFGLSMVVGTWLAAV